MIIDLVALLLLLYGLFIGYSRGVIKSVFAILSIIIGIVAALKLSPIVIDYLQKAVDWHAGLVFVLGFALTFILVLIIVRFIGNKLESLFKFAQINFINKLVGAVLMAGLCIVLYSYALWGIDSFQLLSDQSKGNSMTYSFLETLPIQTQGLIDSLKPLFQSFWDQMLETFDMIKNEADMGSQGSE